MYGRVENVNEEILKQCRIQIGLHLSDVEKKIKKIRAFEEGNLKPTFNQLNILSSLYKVPRWVFIEDKLPEKYILDKSVPVFRQFAKDNSDIFDNSEIRNLITQIEYYRGLLLDLLEDIDEHIGEFDPPNIKKLNCEDISARIRKWLDIGNDTFDFFEFKEMLEEKGVFIFLTSKYQGWSHIDRGLLRGLAIYHKTLPIIIINDSDSKKAQSFTLFHELGHLLIKESSLDNWEYNQKGIENWCDKLAGNILMPKPLIKSQVSEIDNITSIKSLASHFKVSSFAIAVRLRQLNIITQKQYLHLEGILNIEFQRYQKKMKKMDGPIARNRPKEILNQYGHLFTKVVFQAYYNKDIGFHKLSKIFGIKNPSYILKIEGNI